MRKGGFAKELDDKGFSTVVVFVILNLTALCFYVRIILSGVGKV